MKDIKKKLKVICAMSGGVDSSVAAAILKNNGYDVVGVFMKFWREAGTARENLCCSAEAKADARKMATKLGIPFYALDLSREFKKKVVDYLIEEYKKGKTPNPCVECNRHIKFKFLLKKMLELKADFVATGHYARIRKPQIPSTKSQINPKSKIQNLKLLAAKDKKKDQSYFLWTLTQKQLKKILFPIGDYTKAQVRTIAKKWDLPVYEKRESQELCFIGDADLRGFLKARIHAEKGPIITVKGEKVGEHEGLAYYTIGQRKGIKIGGIGPFYVVDKDFKNNALIVAQSDFSEALYKKEMRVRGVNWISKVKLPLKCKVKIRYLTPAVPCIVNRNKVVFNKPQRAVTPGQSAVFYKGNEVLGGGIII